MGSLFIVRDGFSQLADIQIVHWRFILHGFFRSAVFANPSEVISSPLEAHKFIYLRREDVCGKALLKILTGQSRYDDFITIRGGNVLRKPSDIFNIVSKTPPAE